LKAASALADETDVTLIAAYLTVTPNPEAPLVNNRLAWFGPGWEAAADLRQEQTRPGLENFPAGDQTVPTVDTSIGRIAGAICADADYPSLVNQTGDDRAGIPKIPPKGQVPRQRSVTPSALTRTLSP
jgi:predicted amidohydrolase